MAEAIALAAIALAALLGGALVVLGWRHLSETKRSHKDELAAVRTEGKLRTAETSLVSLKAQRDAELARLKRQLRAAEERAKEADELRVEMSEALASGDPRRVAQLHDRMGASLQALLSEAADDGTDRAGGARTEDPPAAPAAGAGDRGDDTAVLPPTL